MAMYGWIASTPGFEDKIKSPQTLSLLKKFSFSEGKEPYQFDLGDVVDTHNSEGSYDHTVWIEILDKSSKQKIGEISTDITDASIGPDNSKTIILAACLDKLGFMDEDSVQQEPEAEEPALAPAIPETPEPMPDVAPKTSARIASAVNLLKSLDRGLVSFKIAKLKTDLNTFITSGNTQATKD